MAEYDITKINYGNNSYIVKDPVARDAAGELTDNITKNILDLSTGQTLEVSGYGIHCIVNPVDGTIFLHGTNSDHKCTGSFNIQIAKPSLLKGIETGVVYKFTCDGYTTATDTIGLYVYTSGLTPYTQFDSYANTELAWNAGWVNDKGTAAGFRLFIRQGTVVNNVTLRPMICKKAFYDVDPSFVPYNDSERNALADVINAGVKNEFVFDGLSGTTSNGLSFQLNVDGSITVSGTLTDSSKSASVSIRYQGDPADIQAFCNGEYVLSGCPRGGGSDTYYLRVQGSGTLYNHYDYGDGVLLSKSTNNSPSFDYIQVIIVIVAGYTMSGSLTFKPMVCKAKYFDISREYAPNKVTPAYFISKAIDEGNKNLINDTRSLVIETQYGVTCVHNFLDGTLTINGTFNGTGAQACRFYLYDGAYTTNPTIPEGAYVFDCNQKDGTTSTWRACLSGLATEYFDRPIPVYRANSTGYLAPYIYINGGSYTNKVFKLMFCKKEHYDLSEAIVPCAVDYKARLADMIDSGPKNICKTRNVTGTAQWQTFTQAVPAGEYVIFFGSITSTDTDASVCQIGFFNSSNQSVGKTYPMIDRGTNKWVRATLTADATYFRVYSSDTAAHGSGDTLTITDMMICKVEDFMVSQNFVPYRPSYQELYDMVLALQSGS